MEIKTIQYILWLEEISKKDIALVGGKNASLGEMFSRFAQLKAQSPNLKAEEVPNIPNGFAISVNAYWHFLRFNHLEEKLHKLFQDFQPQNFLSLKQTGKKARRLILEGKMPPDLEEEIFTAYQKLSQQYSQKEADVAVRSSATVEDTKQSSFAGQMESYLNVKGKKELILAVKKCMASWFTDRAIAYRQAKGVDHLKNGISVGVIKMVRSDRGSSGIMFTLDTETGFAHIVLINAIYGVGEMIVKGRITPDEFIVFKPTLKAGYEALITKTLGRKHYQYIYAKGGGLKKMVVGKEKQKTFSLSDREALQLSRWAMLIEEHYGAPQDIEWAKDGESGQLFIVQSRPETVQSLKNRLLYEEYQIKTEQKPVLEGIAVGEKIVTGNARIIEDVSKLSQFQSGEILITRMTDPDWVPVMRQAAGIITDEGGKTAHAAIISRELGIPCIVGTKNATRLFKNGQEITIDCSLGNKGRIFLGRVAFEKKEYKLDTLPDLGVKIMVNMSSADSAFRVAMLPQQGVGLAREEFIIAEKIRIHPLALIYYEQLKNYARAKTEKINLPGFNIEYSRTKLAQIISKIDELTQTYIDKKEYFVKELAEGIGKIGAAFWPHPVIVRFSDFKTNEYRQLLGGELFEAQEENPMLGWRGASRYYDEKFKPAFLLECKAIKRVREKFGLKNVRVMVPFCRTPQEGEKVLSVMQQAGLERGKEDLQVYVMAELPSNVILAEEFLQIFDGMSIGSNDLTQMVLGIDRDNADLSTIGDERNKAVKAMVKKVIKMCREKNKYCGICGQASSDFPKFAQFLMQEGIESISLNPDTVIKTIFHLAKTKL